MSPAEAIRRAPRKTGILAASSLVAAAIWTGVLTGSEDPRDSLPVVDLNAGLGPAAVVTAADSSAAKAPTHPVSPETEWSASMEKLENWKETLVAPIRIAPPPEAEENATAGTDAVAEPENASAEVETAVPAPSEDLILTSTLLLGKVKKAVLDGFSVQVGDSVGRYVVEDIRSREVDLRAVGRVWTLRMSRPGFSAGIGKTKP